MLTAWMRDNESNKWSVGVKFVQLQKKSVLNKGIRRTPYEALFGKCATVGLTIKPIVFDRKYGVMSKCIKSTKTRLGMHNRLPIT